MNLTRWIVALSLLGAFAPLAKGETLRDAIEGYIRAMEDSAPPEERWKVTGALGATVTSGNSDTQTLTIGLDAERPWDPWKLFLKERSIYGRSGGVESANEHVLTQRLERALSERAWLFEELLVEHDEQESLDYRLQLIFGYKRLLVKKEKFELTAEAGGGVLHEEFRRAPETEGIAQAGVGFKWQITKQLLFTQNVTIYPSLSDTGEFRLESESVFTTPISGKVDLRFSIVDKFDSSPPAGVEDNDLLVGLSLAIRFT